MSKLEHYIVNEAAYDANIGFEEMVTFWKKASESQITDMERIIKSGDWTDFKILIKKVVGVTLK